MRFNSKKLLQKVQLNHKGKDYAVRDIHGCFSLLEIKLQEIGFDKTKDRLFAVGDLVDRGPESERFLDYLTEPWFYSVKGNHEAMLEEYVAKETRQYIYSYNGGDWFIDRQEDNYFVERCLKAIAKMPIIIQIGSCKNPIVLVHSQLPKTDYTEVRKFFLEEYSEHYLSYDLQRSVTNCLWSRNWAGLHSTYLNSTPKSLAKDEFEIMHSKGIDVQGCKAVVSGHTPWKEPQISGNWYSIDTGACYGEDGGIFTILDLLTR